MAILLKSIRDPMPAGALRGAIQTDGAVLWYMPGDTLPPDPVPVLADVKTQRIAQINAECTQRITAVWPLEKQATAMMGKLGLVPGYDDTGYAQMASWVDSHIAASNSASDAVNAATSIAQVEAVTVVWPA